MSKFKDLTQGDKFVFDDVPYIKIYRFIDRANTDFETDITINAINLLFGTWYWFDDDDEVRKELDGRKSF